MKKQDLFNIDSFQQFLILNRAKMTSLWIRLLLLLSDFVPENCRAKFGGNWTTNKGETEGRVAQCAPLPTSLYSEVIVLMPNDIL